MTEIGVLLVGADARIAGDLDRWGIQRTLLVGADAPVEQLVAARTKGESATIFASPRRRWADVMAAVRAAVQVAGGGVSLRFYAPDCLIDVRSEITTGSGRYGVCPLFDPREPISDVKAAVHLKRAVKDGIADLLAAELRALAQTLRDADAAMRARIAGRAA